MEFSKQFPKEDGLYYYLDTEYPIPQVAFCFIRSNQNWMQIIGRPDFHVQHGFLKYFRWGPAVPLPDCPDIKIVD